MAETKASLSSNHDEWERHIKIDDRQESYDIILTKGWSGRVVSLCEGTDYLSAILDLGLGLKAACHVARAPYQIPASVEDFAYGWMQTRLSETASERLALAISSQLARELVDQREVRFDPQQLEVVQRLCLQIRSKVDRVPGPSFEELRGRTWQSLMQDRTFAIAAWGSQRSAYISVYSAYESFLLQCCRVADSDPTLTFERQTRPKTTLERLFGADVADKCWSLDELHVAREVRHAIAHNAGKETHKLRSMNPPHGFDYTDKDRLLIIMPEHTTHLLRTIEQAVEDILAVALA